MKENSNTCGVNTNVEKTERNSSFEILRIVTMYLIVLCHFATHGNFTFDTQIVSIPKLWWYFIEMGGNFGVNVFVLISGYFLSTNRKMSFDLKRVIKYWGQVFFYSIVIYIVFCLARITEFSIVSLLKVFLPISYESWWFASTYFVLYLIHPYLNILLNNLDKRVFQRLLALLLFIWCIIPSLIFSKFQSNSLLWFVTLYSCIFRPKRSPLTAD